MKFHLTIHVLKGKLAGKWISLDFDADSKAKAYEFSSEIQKLKTLNADLVEFGGYTLQRKFGPFLWLTMLSVSKDGEVLYCRDVNNKGRLPDSYNTTGE